MAFGPWLGFAYSLGGLVIAALATYFAGKLMHPHEVQRRAGPRVTQIMQVLRKRGLLAVTALRLVPLAPFAVEGAVAGAINLKLWHYTVGSAIGMLPGTLAATVFSDELRVRSASPATSTSDCSPSWQRCWSAARGSCAAGSCARRAPRGAEFGALRHRQLQHPPLRRYRPALRRRARDQGDRADGLRHRGAAGGREPQRRAARVAAARPSRHRAAHAGHTGPAHHSQVGRIRQRAAHAFSGAQRESPQSQHLVVRAARRARGGARRRRHAAARVRDASRARPHRAPLPDDAAREGSSKPCRASSPACCWAT